MRVHWANFTGLQESTRVRTELRLQSLAENHADLVDVHLAAQHADSQGGHRVKLTCSTRGHAFALAKEREHVRQALDGVLTDFERGIHRLRDRHRSFKRAPRRARAELAPPQLEPSDTDS